MKSEEIFKTVTGRTEFIFSVETREEGLKEFSLMSAQNLVSKNHLCPECGSKVKVRRSKADGFYLSKCSSYEEIAINKKTGFGKLYNKNCRSHELRCPFCSTELRYLHGRRDGSVNIRKRHTVDGLDEM